MARMFKSSVHNCHRLFAWIFAEENVLLVIWSSELPDIHKKAAISILPILFYTGPELWISFTCEMLL